MKALVLSQSIEYLLHRHADTSHNAQHEHDHHTRTVIYILWYLVVVDDVERERARSECRGSHARRQRGHSLGCLLAATSLVPVSVVVVVFGMADQPEPQAGGGLSTSTSDSCVFCDIVAGQLAADIVYSVRCECRWQPGIVTHSLARSCARVPHRTRSSSCSRTTSPMPRCICW